MLLAAELKRVSSGEQQIFSCSMLRVLTICFKTLWELIELILMMKFITPGAVVIGKCREAFNEHLGSKRFFSHAGAIKLLCNHCWKKVTSFWVRPPRRVKKIVFWSQLTLWFAVKHVTSQIHKSILVRFVRDWVRDCVLKSERLACNVKAYKYTSSSWNELMIFMTRSSYITESDPHAVVIYCLVKQSK